MSNKIEEDCESESSNEDIEEENIKYDEYNWRHCNANIGKFETEEIPLSDEELERKFSKFDDECQEIRRINLSKSFQEVNQSEEVKEFEEKPKKKSIFTNTSEVEDLSNNCDTPIPNLNLSEDIITNYTNTDKLRRTDGRSLDNTVIMTKCIKEIRARMAEFRKTFDDFNIKIKESTKDLFKSYNDSLVVDFSDTEKQFQKEYKKLNNPKELAYINQNLNDPIDSERSYDHIKEMLRMIITNVEETKKLEEKQEQDAIVEDLSDSRENVEENDEKIEMVSCIEEKSSGEVMEIEETKEETPFKSIVKRNVICSLEMQLAKDDK